MPQLPDIPTSVAALDPEHREILAFLLPLSPDYPGIEHWFVDKVIPGLADGTRHITRVYRDGRIAALGIAKSDGSERKICTVRVIPDFVGRGLGVRVFDELIDWLSTDQPHLTVGEQKLNAFRGIFGRYRLRMTSTHQGLYVPGRTECLFNENGEASIRE